MSRRVLFFAALCYRLALRRPTNPLEALGLPGVQSRERVEGASSARRFPGRFDSPGFPVLYAATAPATCAASVFAPSGWPMSRNEHCSSGTPPGS